MASSGVPQDAVPCCRVEKMSSHKMGSCLGEFATLEAELSPQHLIPKLTIERFQSYFAHHLLSYRPSVVKARWPFATCD